MTDEDAFRAVRDELAIRDLVASFAEIVNDMRPGDMKTVFSDDAEFVIKGWPTMSGPGAIVGFLADVIGHWDMIFHAVNSGRVALDGDHATGTWYVTEYGRYGDGMENFLGGRYRDRYVRTGDGWRFARREFRSMWRRAEPAGDHLQVWGPTRR
jgi:ketosteroid isomerase-like protein